ncbi:alpha/beta fold hydrolase [Pseudomonas guariconensis]|uniref:thioesterase II family protein n=1 Tax=Pseudomonas TaxID=286 RepID=UPI001CE3E9ED|nr:MULTISPECIES: alpha/beta fold hydrolase [Pseudomonas]MCO7640625.1 alpha/beta fold hydrolase [Pseudomonas sp. S 311-6]MCO7516293.1 alpha/beta fold hydrolase [Pseudomonas putida]MCO7566050.1 alpha/beta fold hydrolase [Pseudomonas mosselii]MCO7596211.1 alpha/beta fold hydrolase [Pseudomonas guariconensis]MCO7606301.1 alpha/beta fold hydrolase [Pseudomonas guariconensis]
MSAVNLLCLPYSGASAMVYSRWRRKLPAWLQVRPVELPGRGARLGEPLQTDMQALARQLASEQRLAASAPYALLGHSLGALLAFELAHELQALGCPAPLALFACGTAAPTRREDYDGKHWRDPKCDDELLAELRELQGTPEEVLANQELMSLTLPILRADFLLCGRYAYRQRSPLQCPVHVLGGEDDRASEEQLLAWRRETVGDFSLALFPGGHFFIHEHEDRVLGRLAESLEPLRLSA